MLNTNLFEEAALIYSVYGKQENLTSRAYPVQKMTTCFFLTHTIPLLHDKNGGMMAHVSIQSIHK